MIDAVSIFCYITITWVQCGLLDNKATLVHAVDGCRVAAIHHLYQRCISIASQLAHREKNGCEALILKLVAFFWGGGEKGVVEIY